jgi:peptide/nickel transport system substrate-binding protein
MSELKYWQNRFAKGHISRREFVGRATALGVTTALATTMAADIVKANPKSGGSLRMAIGAGATTDSLDPGSTTDNYMGLVGMNTGSTLTQILPDGSVAGDLATSFEPADDGKSWVYKLVQGATFHNGKDVTAEDVVATIHYHQGEDSKSAAKSILEQISEVKADGPDTVIFTLTNGSADFPFVTNDYHLPILPAVDGKADWASGVRCGPYKLDNLEPGVTVSMSRYENHYNENEAYFDDIEILSVPDVTARTNALTTGEVQYIDRVDLKTLDLLKQNPNVEIVEVTGYGHYVLPMNVTVPPFDNVHVRQALKYAVDRQDIIDKVFLGHATAGNDNPIAPSVQYAINPEPVFSYDPDKVKFHLGKAGLSSLKVDLSAADAAFAGAVDAAVLYQEHAAKAGIEINVIREPNDSYWDAVWMKKPWCMSYWNGRPTCDWMFATAYAADAEWNDTFWKNDRFNELLLAARAETDTTKRAAMYAEMQQILHDDGGILVLVFNNYVTGNATTLAHDKVGASLEVDSMRLPRRWWFA